MKITKSELKQLIKEALREEMKRPTGARKLREAKCPVEEFTVAEYADLIGGNIDDWDLDGKTAVKIYEPEDMPAGQVGVEFEDGTFGFVGANMDGFARSKNHMLKVICDESCKSR